MVNEVKSDVKEACIKEMIAIFGIDAVRHYCMCNVYKHRFQASSSNKKDDKDAAESEFFVNKLMELENLDMSAFCYNPSERKS